MPGGVAGGGVAGGGVGVGSPAGVRRSKQGWLAVAGAIVLAGVLGAAVVMPGVQQRHKEKHQAAAGAASEVSPMAVPPEPVEASLPPPAEDMAGIVEMATTPQPTTSPPLAAATTKPKTTASSLWSSLTDKLTTTTNKQQNAGLEVDAGFLAIPDCTPRNATELELLVEESRCRVITLLPSTTYVIDHYISITRPVTIIGRPLGIPTIDGHLSYRTFMVEPGGRLDLRVRTPLSFTPPNSPTYKNHVAPNSPTLKSTQTQLTHRTQNPNSPTHPYLHTQYVRLYRGRPRAVVPHLLYVVQGAIMYVRRGGLASMTGCHVTIHPSTRYTNVGISRNPRATTIILGGGVYMEGGLFRATGCVYTTWRPGVIWRETWFVGNEFLVLTGVRKWMGGWVGGWVGGWSR